MAYKSSNSVVLLRDGQAISTRRLWTLRIFIPFLFITSFFRSPPDGIAGLAGSLTAYVIIYYAGLHLLSVNTDNVETPENGGGMKPPAEIESVFDAGVVTKRELQQSVDVSDTTFDDAADWWQAEGREKLSESESVEALDDGGYRWQRT